MTLSVSIITPSFQQAPFLKRTIESVLSQNIDGLEYVVCDGGSTDGSVDILKRFESRLRWVSEPDRGQADAVNKGLAMTSGEIVGWLNSDDIYYPGAIAAALEVFEQEPECSVVYGAADHIDTADRSLEPYPIEPWDALRLREICYLCQPAVFVRRRLIARAGALDTRWHFCLDYEWWLRLAQFTDFHFLPRVLAGSRLYAENKTLADRTAVHAEICDMLQHRFGAVPVRWLVAYSHMATIESMGSGPYMPGHRTRLVAGLLSNGWQAMHRWVPDPDPSGFARAARWLWRRGGGLKRAAIWDQAREAAMGAEAGAGAEAVVADSVESTPHTLR